MCTKFSIIYFWCVIKSWCGWKRKQQHQTTREDKFGAGTEISIAKLRVIAFMTHSHSNAVRNKQMLTLHSLLKKMTPEQKGITFVTSFGRQKAFWLEMYHLHMLYRLFKKVAAKQQCFAFLGKMHDLGLGKGLWKESMHFFATCLNCSERWYHLSKMENSRIYPERVLIANSKAIPLWMMP